MEEKVIIYGLYRFAKRNPNPKTEEQKIRNTDIEELQKHYIIEMKKQKDVTMTDDELENVKFEKEFIEKLKKKNGSANLKEIAESLVQHDSSNASAKFDKLNNLFGIKKEYVFSDYFIDDSSNISDTAKNFRSILFKNCEIQAAKDLKNCELIVTSNYTI
uniref:Uncharacterized protein n=1 Tax=Panagrolaimus sp. ES5 TaxID=591445 RepID=A0AC34GL00_9BILA